MRCRPPALVRRVPVELSSHSVSRNGGAAPTRPPWAADLLRCAGVIGSGILALPYAVAMLGWVGGLVALLLFAQITLYTSQVCGRDAWAAAA